MIVVQFIRAFLRVLAFVVVSMLALVFVLLSRATGFGVQGGHRVMYVWRRIMSAALNLRITQEGDIPRTSTLVMSNHRSYIDILLHQTGVPMVFVAKRSVKAWPIVGWGASSLKTIFVERSSAKSRAKTRSDIRDRLQNGLSVLLYPEGTTHRGPEVLPYRPGVFRIAAEEGFPITASAIEYENQDLAWTGTAKFIPHFLKTFGGRRLHATVRFGGPFQDDDPDRLLAQVESWTNSALLEIRAQYDARS